MSLIDYGVMLKVDGVFVNRDKDRFLNMYTDPSITEPMIYDNGVKKDFTKSNIVTIGNNNFMVGFYKNLITIVRNCEIEATFLGTKFIKETIYYPRPNVRLTIQHLDNKKHDISCLDIEPDFKSFLQNWYWKEFDDKDVKKYKKGKLYKRYVRLLKNAKRRIIYEYSNRYYATLDYNNKHYEIIFGYGIDSSEEIWDYIKNEEKKGNGFGYDFSEKEKEIIDSWFD